MATHIACDSWTTSYTRVLCIDPARTTIEEMTLDPPGPPASENDALVIKAIAAADFVFGATLFAISKAMGRDYRDLSCREMHRLPNGRRMMVFWLDSTREEVASRPAFTFHSGQLLRAAVPGLSYLVICAPKPTEEERTAPYIAMDPNTSNPLEVFTGLVANGSFTVSWEPSGRTLPREGKRWPRVRITQVGNVVIEKADLEKFVCFVCNTLTASRCSVCEGVAYCGRVCQKADWPRHKMVCAGPALPHPVITRGV